MSDVNTKPITMEADEEVVDVDKIMAEFDKESNTRHFSGVFEKIIKIAMVLFSLYVMVDGWFGTMEERQKMSWFIGVIVFMEFIIYPVSKKEKKKLNLKNPKNMITVIAAVVAVVRKIGTILRRPAS